MKTTLTMLAATAAFMGLLSTPADARAESFVLSSPDIRAGQPIAQPFAFDGFGCTGQNLSPALTWRNAPAGTKSLAVMAAGLSPQ